MESKKFNNSIIEKLEEIVSLNNSIDNLCDLIDSSTLSQISPLKYKNEKANHLLEKFKANPNSSDLIFEYKKFCAYEFTLTETDNGFPMYNTLLNKVSYFYDIDNNDDVDNIRRILKLNNLALESFKFDDEEVVIVTAVPVEFISIARKLDIILTSSDVNLLEELLDEKISLDDKKDFKKSISICGILKRDNRRVKVRIIMPSSYASLNVLDYLNTFKKKYKFKNEILLVGIAGHLDKTNKVKIGHLVISDGFYNAYEQKIGNTGINYTNNTPILICDDYDSPNFEIKNWYPSNFSEKAPVIMNIERESHSKEIHIGKFVSLHAVNKSTYSKTQLQDAFKGSLAVEMEATGCYTFIQSKNNRIKLKIIKSICDWSDETKEKRWQPYCAELATEFTVDYLIAKYGKEIETK